jgi:hypothetical protein
MTTTTITTISNTTTSTQVVAANTRRSALRIVLNGAINAYILQGSGTASSTSRTFTLDTFAVPGVTISGSEAEQAFQVVFASSGAGSIVATETLTEALAGASTTSILGIVQQVCKRPLGIEPPDALYASTDRTAQELSEVANAALDVINKAHRWRKLVQRATYTGDGSTVDFDLPEDFGFMPDDQQVWSSTAQIPLIPVHSLDDWLALDVRNFNPGTNAWIIYGDQIHFTPALDSGEVANHFYQSTASVQPASGTAKSTFTLDTDTFRINDELLRKAIIYLWKQDKGLPYAEFQNDYEILKEKLIARDKGATIMRQGRPRWPKGVNLAFPLTVPGGT